MKTYVNVAIEAPRLTRLQYRNLPLNAFVVIRMLIGPAIGMEKMNPANKPVIEIVIRLDVMDPVLFLN